MIDEDRLLTRALNISYYFLKSRPRTIAEVKERLSLRARQKPKRYPFTDELIDKAIAQLVEESLLDDKKFVEWFVRYRSIMKPKGTYVLKQELKKFGAPQQIIDDYFEQNPVDEESAACTLIEKRKGRYSRLPALERNKKLTDFLLRRGFSFGTAKKAIAKLEDE